MNLTSTGRLIRCYDAKALLRQGPRSERAKIVHLVIACCKPICFHVFVLENKWMTKYWQRFVRNKHSNSCTLFNLRANWVLSFVSRTLSDRTLDLSANKVARRFVFLCVVERCSGWTFPKFAQLSNKKNLQTSYYLSSVYCYPRKWS